MSTSSAAPESGNGSSPHAWGMANANMVLLDSLAAQRSDGSLVVGRGVPDSWVSSGQVISLANFPTTDGRHTGLTIRTSGEAVTLTFSGDHPAGHRSHRHRPAHPPRRLSGARIVCSYPPDVGGNCTR